MSGPDDADDVFKIRKSELHSPKANRAHIISNTFKLFAIVTIVSLLLVTRDYACSRNNYTSSFCPINR